MWVGLQANVAQLVAGKIYPPLTSAWMFSPTMSIAENLFISVQSCYPHLYHKHQVFRFSKALCFDTFIHWY